MGSGRPGVLIYWELLEVLEGLSGEQARIMLGAILRYSRDGEDPRFAGDPLLSALWLLVKPKLDGDATRYEKVIEQRRNAGRASAAKRRAESNERQRPLTDVDTRQRNQPTTTPTATPTTTPTATIECMAPPAALPAPTKPPKPKVVRHEYGKYGWVKLSDEEHSRLLNDLGRSELERCITYIDESAQTSGNKNKWRDWNLVIRRCHREGWGQRGKQAEPKQPFVYNPGEILWSLGDV